MGYWRVVAVLSLQSRSFDGIAFVQRGMGGGPLLTAADGTIEPAERQSTSANFFDVLSVVPLVGRMFKSEDEGPRRAWYCSARRCGGGDSPRIRRSLGRSFGEAQAQRRYFSVGRESGIATTRAASTTESAR